MNKPVIPPALKGHGRVERGLDDTPRSRSHKGRFGRMFRSLPAANFEDGMLANLATSGGMTADREADVTPESEIDNEENFGLPAGYTYFGQFVDHDMTFDPQSSLVKRNDPDGLTNFRTPALDLDSLYGGGPEDQPYLYDEEGRKFLLSDRDLLGILSPEEKQVPITKDLPRFKGRALIGDKRNDENVIISQLHGLFLKFHNKIADRRPDLNFREIQQLVRWHYQWLVLFDYLPRIVGRDLIENILPHITDNSSIYEKQPQLRFYNYKNDPFMPVEFSVAAYRFGHSMVRPVYRLSAFDFTDPELVKIEGMEGRKMLFNIDPKLALNGFQEFDAENGIDWRLFFETKDRPISSEILGKDRVQPAYKIDTSLVNPLAFLPEHSIRGTEKPLDGRPNTNNLAFRNLKRGVMLELPSGQSVARLMGLEPIADERLLVGKATGENLASDPWNKSGIKLKSIVDIDEGFAGKAPLWFYILAEAMDGWRKIADGLDTDEAKDAVPTILGPVGGRIVAEVIIGIILGDSDSFLNMDPNWKPPFQKQETGSFFDRFTMGDFLELV